MGFLFFGQFHFSIDKSTAFSTLNVLNLDVSLLSFLHWWSAHSYFIFVLYINLSLPSYWSMELQWIWWLMVFNSLAFLPDEGDLPQELVSYFETHSLGRERQVRAIFEGAELNPLSYRMEVSALAQSTMWDQFFVQCCHEHSQIFLKVFLILLFIFACLIMSF